ncbi:MAG TPA: HD domain-containing protein [Candidatus Eremiobacteraceae bacterium]|nr:HD domain-containing protein [Candidatus Eremiobacteraceae bacterium]
MQSNVTSLRSSLFKQLQHDPEIIALIDKADEVVAAMGYTDHGRRHVTMVGVNASRVLARLGYDAQVCDLAAVAGLLHDLGNCAGRHGHASAGAVFVYQLLTARGVPSSAAATVMTAIANHDELEQGTPVDAPSAALIIADKAEIHRSRVRTPRSEDFDIHDRVNYAVVKAELDVQAAEKSISLRLTADQEYAVPADILDLFSSRFAMSRSAAEFLGCSYSVLVNGETIF